MKIPDSIIAAAESQGAIPWDFYYEILRAVRDALLTRALSEGHTFVTTGSAAGGSSRSCTPGSRTIRTPITLVPRDRARTATRSA